MTSPNIPEVLTRIQEEFRELPGLRLTEPQAQRLWALDPVLCAGVLAALVDAKVLRRTAEGAVVAGQSVNAASPAWRASTPSATITSRARRIALSGGSLASSR